MDWNTSYRFESVVHKELVAMEIVRQRTHYSKNDKGKEYLSCFSYINGSTR